MSLKGVWNGACKLGIEHQDAGWQEADIVLLAGVDEAHETLSGPATRQILRREYSDYGQAKYERLADISAAQSIVWAKAPPTGSDG